MRYTPSRSQKLFYGYVVFLFAFIIQIAMLGPRASYGVFFKPMMYELDWERALISGAYSVSQLVQGISGVFMGGLSDRFGPRAVMSVCGILVGAGVILMSRATLAWQLYLFYGLIVGTGMGGLVAPLFSTVARWFVKRRSMMTGLLAAGGGGGMMVMPLLANWLMPTGWRNASLILGGIIMAVTILAAQFLKRDPAQIGQKPLGANGPEADVRMDTEGFSVNEAIRAREFWMLLMMMFAYGAGASTVMVHYVPHMTDLGIPATTAAIIFSVLGGSVVAGGIIMGTFANRAGNKLASIISFAVLATALLLLLIAREPWMLYLLPLAFGLAFGGLTPLQSTLVAEMFGMKSHGLLMGICSFGLLIGAASGPFVAGYVFDRYGTYSPAFLGVGLLAAVGFILAIWLRPPIWHLGNQAKRPPSTGSVTPVI